MNEKYYELLEDKRKITLKINKIKKESNRKFRKIHKNIIRLFDIMIILIFVFNILALLITNSLVVKKTVDEQKPLQLYEVNTAVTERTNYESIDKVKGAGAGNDLLKQFILHCLILSFVAIFYLIMRINVSTEMELFIMGCIFGIFFLIIAFDFINDLGYWIGYLFFK